MTISTIQVIQMYTRNCSRILPKKYVSPYTIFFWICTKKRIKRQRDTNLLIHIHTDTHTNIHVCTHSLTYKYTRAHTTYIYIFMSVYLCIHVNTNTCRFIYIQFVCLLKIYHRLNIYWCFQYKTITSLTGVILLFICMLTFVLNNGH